MIRQRHISEYVIEFEISGNQSAAAGNPSTTCSAIVPFPSYLKAIYARNSVAGTTGTQTTDLLKNAASLVSSGTLLSYASGSQSPTYNTANLNSNPPIFAKGDVLQLKNTAVQTTPAVDQVVLVVLARLRQIEQGYAVQTDTIGADVDTV